LKTLVIKLLMLLKLEQLSWKWWNFWIGRYPWLLLNNL